MASIPAIRDGLKTRLATITGLRAYDVVPGQIAAPAAVVKRRRTNYDVTFGGDHDFEFTVSLFVQAADQRSAQDALDAYLATSGAGSIIGAIEGDKTLGGIVSFAVVRDAGEDRLVDYAGVEYLSVDFLIEVTT